MSGKSLVKKLSRSLARVAGKTGFKYKVYRSVDQLTPVQTKNLIGEVQMAYALDNTFNKAYGYGFNLFNLFFDVSQYELGDIFVNEEFNRRFTLVCNEQLSTPQGVESSGSISISRPAYTTSGEFKSISTDVALNIPAMILSSGASQDSVSNTGQSSQKTGSQEWSIWLWLPRDAIKMNDIVTDQSGNKSIVKTIEYSQLGYRIKTVSTKVGS